MKTIAQNEKARIDIKGFYENESIGLRYYLLSKEEDIPLAGLIRSDGSFEMNDTYHGDRLIGNPGDLKNIYDICARILKGAKESGKKILEDNLLAPAIEMLGPANPLAETN